MDDLDAPNGPDCLTRSEIAGEDIVQGGAPEREKCVHHLNGSSQ